MPVWLHASHYHNDTEKNQIHCARAEQSLSIGEGYHQPVGSQDLLIGIRGSKSLQDKYYCGCAMLGSDFSYDRRLASCISNLAAFDLFKPFIVIDPFSIERIARHQDKVTLIIISYTRWRVEST